MDHDPAFTSPPYELRSERLLLRCWQPADAKLLKEAVDSSLEHLRPWMPWAHDEPQSLPAKAELLRTFRGRFDLGQDFVYGAFEPDETRVLGGCGLHPRSGPGTLEIGYWIRADSLRQGYARELTSMLAVAAFRICSVERLDVIVDPANAASAGIPRSLGFREEAVLRRHLPPGRDGEQRRDGLLFTMVDGEFAQSALAKLELDAVDCSGASTRLGPG